MRYIKVLNDNFNNNTDEQFGYSEYVEEYLKYQLIRENCENYFDSILDSTEEPKFNNSIVINYDRTNYESNKNTKKSEFVYNFNRIYSQYDNINFLDICYLDRTGEIYITDKILKKDRGYTPLAICCIPTNFFFGPGTTDNSDDIINKPGSCARFVNCYGHKIVNITNIASQNIDSTSYLKKFKDYYLNTANTFTTLDAGLVIPSNKKFEYFESDILDSAAQHDQNLKKISQNRFSKHSFTYRYYLQYVEMVANQTRPKIYDYSTKSEKTGDPDNLYTYDYYGFENTFLCYEASNNLRNKLDFTRPNKNITWYIPSIAECIYLYMHIQEIKDVCEALSNEYGLENYDMFRTDIDIYSSSIIIGSNSTPIIPIVDKYGWAFNKNKGIEPSGASYTLISTYPMFQL